MGFRLRLFGFGRRIWGLERRGRDRSAGRGRRGGERMEKIIEEETKKTRYLESIKRSV